MQALSAICLFCEDIREEKKDTDILVGIFPDNLAVPHVPGNLLKLALYARVHVPIENPPHSLALRVELPDGETIELGSMSEKEANDAIESAIQRGAPFAGFVIKAIIAPLRVNAAGVIQAIIRVGDEDYLGGFLNVIVRDAENASAQTDLTTVLPVSPAETR